MSRSTDRTSWYTTIRSISRSRRMDRMLTRSFRRRGSSCVSDGLKPYPGRADLERMGHTGSKRHVPAVMADRKPETYREVESLDDIPNDLIRGGAEWPGRVLAVGKTPDDHSGEAVEAAAPQQLPEHAIYIV